MVYANLCFSYLNNLRMAFVFLDRMRHLDPPVDIRFYIYRKDTGISPIFNSYNF